MTRSTTISAFALALLLSGTAAAQNPPAPPKAAPPKAAGMTTHKPTHRVREAKPGLLKQAKISAETAEQTALGSVPGGTVTSRKIEKEKGLLVYAFGIKTTGKDGYDLVLIDANTGALVSNTHKNAMPAKPGKKPQQ
jgi:peptidase YpeB-like protein